MSGRPSVVGGGLLFEVAVLGHAGELHDVPERELSPPSLCLVAAKGRVERGRLLGEPRGLRVERGELLRQLRVGTRARTLDLAGSLLELVERLAERTQQRGDLLLARIEIGGRLLTRGGPSLLGELEEMVGAAPERVGGERLEGVLHLPAGLLARVGLRLRGRRACLGGAHARVGLREARLRLGAMARESCLPHRPRDEIPEADARNARGDGGYDGGRFDRHGGSSVGNGFPGESSDAFCVKGDLH